MSNPDITARLERIIADLGRIDGVDGSIITDNSGNILAHRILYEDAVQLFGPMAQIIINSSRRLLTATGQGDIERVLVESDKGKALFLYLNTAQLIVLMKTSANVGMVLVSSKRAAKEIMEVTKNLTLEPAIAEEVEISSTKDKEEKTITIKETFNVEEIKTTTANEVPQTDETLTESIESSEQYVSDETIEAEKEKIIEESSEGTILEEEAQKPVIPVIKPPITFPEIEKVEQIPEDKAERIDLILKIYESIFLAMSIGASKIMGVTPARGLTQQFLPFEQCQKLLKGVDVKSNSTLDFKKIRENVEAIDEENIEEKLITDFSKIIDVITENYGRVMGYAAFRGMVRPEFRNINNSYGKVMVELGIKDKIHEQLLELL